MSAPSALADALFVAGDHLWQSTLFAAVAALVALALRGGPAHVRYCVWLAASAKFLVPFAPLVALGAYWPWRAADAAPAAGVALLVETVGEPFSRTMATTAAAAHQPWFVEWVAVLPAALGTAWAVGSVAVCAAWLTRWRRMRAIVRRSARLRTGREVDLVRRLAAAHRVAPLSVVATAAAVEPGVFGIVRPVLIWPARLGDRLSDEQAEAILAHELCHLRRRDNLAGALHMAVEALFWFHPLVWWIGARLIDEREHACDEEVVRLGSDPAVYAASILATCRSCLESRLACVAGVTGADLKRRIEHITTSEPAGPLRPVARALVVTAAVAALAAPIVFGAFNAPPLSARTLPQDEPMLAFEVASVKPNDGSQMRVMQRFTPGGGFEGFNVTTGAVMRLAYRLQDFQMVGEPEWVHVDRFDILAKGPAGARQNEIALRLRSLLAERFKLQAHMGTREVPVYALTLARSDGAPGPQLRPSAVDCDAVQAERARSGAPLLPMPQPGQRPPCGTTRRRGGLTGGGMTMAQLAMMLAQFTGRIVIDRTGLTGGYDLDLDFAAEPPRLGAGLGGGLPADARPLEADGQGLSIFTAVEEQLGLRLVSETAPVEVLVVEHIERPTAD